MKAISPIVIVGAFFAVLFTIGSVGEAYEIPMLQARFTEIVQLTLILIIAWIVNGRVSRKVKIEEKRLDTALKYLDEIDSAIGAIACQYESYICSGEKTAAREIVRQFKKCRAVLGRAERLMKDSSPGDMHRFKAALQEHKELLTDGEFLKDEPHFSEDTKHQFDESSNRLSYELEEVRVALLTQ